MVMGPYNVNARSDGLPGTEEERSRDAFVNLGSNRWARRIIGSDGQSVTFSLEDVMTVLLYEVRAIRLGIEKLYNNKFDDDVDLLELAVNYEE